MPRRQHPNPAALICNLITGRAVTVPLDDLPHPWNSIALKMYLVAPHQRMNAFRRLLKSFSNEDLTILENGLKEVYRHENRAALTPRQHEVYAAVRRHGPIQVGMLAKLIGQDTGNTFRRLQTLVSLGLVRRQKEFDSVFYHLA